MNNITHGIIGSIHLWASMLSLVTGTMVLVMNKGTLRHKRIGYVYAISMAVLNATAFMLYNLFGTFHMFHVAALVSSLTLIAGMRAAILRKNPQWLIQHLAFMYWSVFGLYAAFWSEVFTRLIPANFMWMVGIATFLTIGAGYLFFKTYKSKWMKINFNTK
jgi:uncharacterized membrane protein